MNRPEPIEYAERLYDAIRDANFSPISFLAFGNAVKDGVTLRNLPRMAAEPFMRIVGEMLDLEEEVSAEQEIFDAETVAEAPAIRLSPVETQAQMTGAGPAESPASHEPQEATATATATEVKSELPGAAPTTNGERRRNGKR